MPDPAPEKLFIYLHAWRYTTSLGVFECGIPQWAERREGVELDDVGRKGEGEKTEI
jgi:hypothetical protein